MCQSILFKEQQQGGCTPHAPSLAWVPMDTMTTPWEPAPATKRSRSAGSGLAGSAMMGPTSLVSGVSGRVCDKRCPSVSQGLPAWLPGLHRVAGCAKNPGSYRGIFSQAGTNQPHSVLISVSARGTCYVIAARHP